MNIKIANFGASIGLLISWFILIVLAGVIGPQGGDTAHMIIGLFMYGLWAMNLIGVIVGVVSLVKEWKGWLGWLALFNHVGQIVLTLLITIIGLLFNAAAAEALNNVK